MRQVLGSKKVLQALSEGNPQPLIDMHRSIFGDLRMEADGDGTDGGTDGDDDSDDADGDDAEGDDQSKKGKTQGSTPAELAELRRENAERRKAANALKQQNEELAARLKKFEDANKGELEKAQGDLAEVTQQRDTLQEQVQNLLIQNAFLMDNKFTWANPKAALKLADLSEVEIDEDGTVSGLSEALAKLAKSDPYLLKSKKDDEDDEDDGPPPAGQPVGGRKPKGNPSRDKLLAKYPALRR